MAEVRAARPPPAPSGLREAAGGRRGGGELSHCALWARDTKRTWRPEPGAASRRAAQPPARPASSASLLRRRSASETGLRKAKDRRKSYLCRLLRNTTRGGRRAHLPAYTCWDSPYKSDTRLICRQSLCTGLKEGALMTTCHRLSLKKPLQWSNK